jgi:FkbM family methyltransferase
MASLELLKKPLRPVRDLGLHLVSYGRGLSRTVNGTTFRVDARSRLGFPEVYDRGVTDFLRSQLRPGDEVWNIGANVGVHVLQLCSIVGPTGTVVAFEPNKKAAALLRRNVNLNGYSNRVTIIEEAIGEQSGRVEFYISGADPMGRPDRPNPLLSRTRAVEVAVTTLDDFFDQRKVVPRCLLIDIEGWEIGALHGGQILLQSSLSAMLIVVELHPNAWSWSGHSREQLDTLLAKFGLAATALSGQQDPLAEHGQVWLRCAKANDFSSGSAE